MSSKIRALSLKKILTVIFLLFLLIMVADNKAERKEILDDILKQVKTEKVDNVARAGTYLVIKVVDGDTLDVVINEETKRVRVIGIDTPELVDPRQEVECFGLEASNKAKELLNNQYVTLEIDDSQDLVDKYGRLLRHIILEDGSNFAELMIIDGFAREYTFIKPSKYQIIFSQAEMVAENNKRGLWADGVCDSGA